MQRASLGHSKMNIDQTAEIATLVGDPARTAMLAELMDGRSLTARELADVARITPQTASSHLSCLVAAGLLSVNPQGRHRYHRLSGPHVARMLQGMMQIACEPGRAAHRTRAPGPKEKPLNAARTCYDHL